MIDRPFFRIHIFPGVAFFLFLQINSQGQPDKYSVSNAHSHNDYEQRFPFRLAYDAGFGSIEADIFLVDTVLYVAHDPSELSRKMTLETAYIVPLLNALKKNKGHAYANQEKKLQMLIDIKTDSLRTLQALISLLKSHPALIHCTSLSWVITGNRPDEKTFVLYPSFIRFDGELFKNYSTSSMTKINLLSDDFKKYSSWNGQHKLEQKEEEKLRELVKKAHRLHKPIRFWDAPDFENAWKQLMLLDVDYINTDHIEALTAYLKK